MGDSVQISKLAGVLELSVQETKAILDEMQNEYQQEERGIQMVLLEDRVQLCTKPDCYEAVIQIAKQPKRHVLSEVVLETLAIIAYKQPVTKLEIEKIRGVKSDHAVNKLLEYELVQELGRLDAPGRPILFGTTEEFLRCFGVQSASDLPVITPELLEEFKSEAEEEMQTKVEV